MQNIFDYNARANQSLVGGGSATRALGLPVQRDMPGNFAPGASNQQADELLSQIEARTAAMSAPSAPAPTGQPVVGYNPQTNEVFSGGKTFLLDLDQGAAHAALLDVDNPQLPTGFVPVHGSEVKARLSRDYQSMGLVDSAQRRAGQADILHGGADVRDGLPGADTLQNYGGALARRNPSHITGAKDLLDSPGQAVKEAVGEIAYDVPVAIAETAIGAKVGAAVGGVLAPVTGGASIPIGAILGGAAGRFLGTLFETYGSVRADQRTKGMDDKGRALLAGSGSAALESLLGPEAALGGVTSRMIGRAGARGALLGAVETTNRGVGRTLGREAVLGAVTEGPLTEVPQSAIERWGAGNDVLGPQAMDEYAIGAFKGAVGGAAMSPMAALPEYQQAKNFIANLQEDISLASDTQAASPDRLAAARRVQEVLQGASSDPAFNQQLQEFRQKLMFLDAKMAEQDAADAAANAIATGGPANLLDMRTALTPGGEAALGGITPDAETDPTSMQARAQLGGPLALRGGMPVSTPLTPAQQDAASPGVARPVDGELSPAQQAALAGPQSPMAAPLSPMQAMFAQGPQAAPAPVTPWQEPDEVGLGASTQIPQDPGSEAMRMQLAGPLMGDRLGDPNAAPSSPITGSSATIPPTTPVDGASPAGSAVVSSSIPASAGLDDSPAESQGPAGAFSSDEDMADIEADIEAAVARVLGAQASSAPGKAAGRVNLPQGVLAGIARAVRSGGKPPVVYSKGSTVDRAATEQWAQRMRAISDAATAVSDTADKLFNRESNVVPSTSDGAGKRQGNKALTSKDVESATIKAGDAVADVTTLRAQLRTAVDNLRSAAGGDMNVEAIVAVLKGRVQKIQSKNAADAKADVSLDTTLSRAWAMYKDGALDNIEQSDVVRGRSIRESFEQKKKGATEPPLLTAAEEGSVRRPTRQRKGESDKAYKARIEAAKEKGVAGVVAYLQLHGTAFERLLAASVGRALRRFSGTADAPKLEWLTDDAAPSYDPKTNTLRIHKEASPEEILHETLHAALQWYVHQNPDTAEVQMLDKALQKVLDAPAEKFTGKAAEVVAVLRKVAKGRNKTARLDAVLELISYGSTLSEFRNALKKLESVQNPEEGLLSGLTAIWHRITLLVQKFLGVSSTVANDVLDGTIALLEQAEDPSIDAPGKRKGAVLKADVMSGIPDPLSMTAQQLLQRPGASLPSDADVSRYNNTVLPEILSTKVIFDMLGWGKAATRIDKGTKALGDKVRKDFPGLARWVSYVAPRFSVPQDAIGAFEQYKDDKQAGYKLTERLATFIQFQPPEKVKAIFAYLDGDSKALGDDTAMAELADEVKRWRDFYVSRLHNDKATRFFSSGKFSETMLFATGDNVASQTFGMRKLNSMLGEKKLSEQTLEESWMNLSAQGDPVLEGAFYEVYRMQGTQRVHDGFIARDKFDASGAPGGHNVDTEYVWFHTSFANGKHTFRASMTAKQAIDAKRSDDLSNALRNTMAALASNYASMQFAQSLADFGHSTGNPDMAVAFDTIADAEKALGVKIDPDTLLKAGSDQARGSREQHLYRSPHLWVQLPASDAYGALAGKIIRSGAWMAMQDMSDRRPAVNLPVLNTTMRWFKKSKTVYNPGTHLTNIASNFTLAMLHDIPVPTIKEAARLLLQYERAPNAMKPAERRLVLAFISSNAMVGDFSSAEVKQALFDAMQKAVDGDKPSLIGRLAEFAKIEKATAQVVEDWAKKGGHAADRIDTAITDAYAAGDNVFRMAAYLKRAADLAATRDDGQPTAADLANAGDFARWAFLDYDIDSKAVRIARQTVLPFVSWTYAILPVLGKIAVHQPWKLANVMLAYAVLEHVAQELTGGDDEDERLRKAGPQYVRDRMFGFGPYVHVRIPFLGDDKTPVYYRLGDYMPWTTVARGQPNGFMGQEWFPSAITPTGPLVSTLLTALAGIDPYFGKPLNAPTDSNWDVLTTRAREIAGLAIPPVALDAARWDKVADITKGRVDRPENFEALQMARWAGLKAYSFNEDQARAAQNKAAGAVMAEYRKELGKLRRAEARFENPDWEAFGEKQAELLGRMNDEIKDIRGE